MTLMLHNTMARKKEPFKPFDAKNVRMYVCGPTVYDYAHIGNARPYVVFDILFRLLRREFGEDCVKYARNITDIDDKIMARAADEGKSTDEIAAHYTDIFHNDMARLGNLTPTIEPKATDHLPEMIAMMETLIEKGHAYEAEGHVLFDVPSMSHYGRLSKRPMDEMIAGARVEVAPYKKNPADFVMWKPSTDDQPGWESPWGKGRPGWHLECSSMIEKHLGETIDIHGGGIDLIFPHHENEVAQSECAHGAKFVGTWMHNGYLVFSGEKMSKSLGNIKTIDGLIEQFGVKGPEALRLTLLSAHYRQPLEFTDDVVKKQINKLNRWQKITKGVKPAAEVPSQVIEALSDDLNTPKALAKLSRLAKDGKAAELKAGAQFLGLLMIDHDDWFQGEGGPTISKIVSSGNVTVSASDWKKIVEGKIAERIEARKSKDFARADAIRNDLDAAGVVLEDKPDGTTEWRRAD